MAPDSTSSPSGVPWLAQLRSQYRISVAEQARHLRELADRLARDPGDVATLTALRGEAHRIRGTAGSYGFTGAARLMAALEGLMCDWLADPAAQRAQRYALVVRLLDDLPAAVQQD